MYVVYWIRIISCIIICIHSLIPILLNGMKYSQDDIALLNADIEDENVPDKESEIRPWFPKGKSHMVGNVQTEEESDDEAEYREEVLCDWNLRK